MSKEESFEEKYVALGHALQSGVMLDQDSGSNDGSPKQLRTGINLAMVQIGALCELLISKGICTNEEVEAEVLKYMEREVEEYEAFLSAKFKKTIKLA